MQMSDLASSVRAQIEAIPALDLNTLMDGYTLIPNAVLCNPRYSDADVRIYGIMSHYAYGDRTYCYPGQEAVGIRAGKTRKTVNTILGRIEDEGLIQRIRRGQELTSVCVLTQLPADVEQEYHEKYGYARDQGPKQVVDCVPADNEAAKPYGSSDVTFTGHPDVRSTGHEENNINNISQLVVVDAQNMTNNNPSNEGSTPPTKQIQTMIAQGTVLDKPNHLTVSDIQTTVTTVTGGIALNLPTACRLTHDYTRDEVLTAVACLGAELAAGAEIANVNAYLSDAMKYGWTPRYRGVASAKREKTAVKSVRSRCASLVGRSMGGEVYIEIPGRGVVPVPGVSAANVPTTYGEFNRFIPLGHAEKYMSREVLAAALSVGTVCDQLDALRNVS